MLESAVAAGIMSMGGTALLAGIIPTPAIALLTRELHCDGGIVISASHNPPEYNGIKIFDGQGFKLPDSVEDEIEAFMARGGAAADELPNGDEVGVAVPVEDACELYIQHAVQSVEKQGIDFKGLKVALDTGHGASCMTSAEALRRSGCRRHRHQRRLLRHGHQRPVRFHAPGALCAPWSPSAAPMWALRMTATPTASCSWTPRATRSTATWWKPCAPST